MRNLYQNTDGTWEVHAGCSITPTINEAISVAASDMRRVTFKFNDVIVNVEGDSNPELIQRDWSRAMSGFIVPAIVGPFPSAELSPEDLASDAKIQSANDEERRLSHLEYERKANEKRKAAEDRLRGVEFQVKPGTELEYQSYKAKNSDPYGGAVVTYSERWAKLMQVEMANGKRIADMADQTSHAADIEGITGFMYGCAVQALAHYWKHGEALRLWHNIKTQIKDEGVKANESGGVLNPACLTVG